MEKLNIITYKFNEHLLRCRIFADLLYFSLRNPFIIRIQFKK